MKKNDKRTPYQIGYLKGYLAKPPGPPEEEAGYRAGVRDANRDRCA